MLSVLLESYHAKVTDLKEKLKAQIKRFDLFLRTTFQTLRTWPNKPKDLVQISQMKNGYQISKLENIKVLARKSSNRILYSAVGNVISTTTQKNNLAIACKFEWHIDFNLATPFPWIYVYNTYCVYI